MATSPPITDLRRTHPGLYRAPDTPVRLTVPPLQYLMLDGAGDPRLGPAHPGDPQLAPASMDAVLTLYAVSYGLRFMVKDAGGEPWTVMPLEGMWWADDMASFSVGRRDDWLWTAMIAQPSVVTADLVADAVAAAVRKGKAPSAEGLRLEVFDEGDSAQVMHHGPFTDEGPTIARLHAFIADAGLQRRGKAPRGVPQQRAPHVPGEAAHDPAPAGLGRLIAHRPPSLAASVAPTAREEPS